MLKKDWKFPGFVLSDWGGTHATEKASAAGLDNEEPGSFFFGDKIQGCRSMRATISTAELDEHVHRILRSMFAAGVIDYPRQRFVVDPFAGFETARKIEEGGIVLLKNEHAVLPLNAARLHTIAVIGSHSDVGMISGGGSAQVDPIGGNAIMPAGQRRDALDGGDLVPDLAAEGDPGARSQGDGEVRPRHRSSCGRSRSQGRGRGHRLRLQVGERRHGPAQPHTCRMTRMR